jgi:hypothetical protein
VPFSHGPKLAGEDYRHPIGGVSAVKSLAAVTIMVQDFSGSPLSTSCRPETSDGDPRAGRTGVPVGLLADRRLSVVHARAQP